MAETLLGQLPQAPAILLCLLSGSGEEAGCCLLGPGRSRPRGPAAGLAASQRSFSCPFCTSLSPLPDRQVIISPAPKVTLGEGRQPASVHGTNTGKVPRSSMSSTSALEGEGTPPGTPGTSKCPALHPFPPSLATSGSICCSGQTSGDTQPAFDDTRSC